MSRFLLSLAAIVAAGVPLLPRASPSPAAPVQWPSRYEGRLLSAIPPAAEDARLALDFPGRIARFTDGRRQIVMRSVRSATRQLHPARDCFQAIGYEIRPAPMQPLAGGGFASCFEASRNGARFRVCEHLRDAAGASFPDASSWYWPALLGNSNGPWLATTIVEPVA